MMWQCLIIHGTDLSFFLCLYIRTTENDVTMFNHPWGPPIIHFNIARQRRTMSVEASRSVMAKTSRRRTTCEGDEVGGEDGRPLGHRPFCHAAQSYTKKRLVKSMPNVEVEARGRQAMGDTILISDRAKEEDVTATRVVSPGVHDRAKEEDAAATRVVSLGVHSTCTSISFLSISSHGQWGQ